MDIREIKIKTTPYNRTGYILPFIHPNIEISQGYNGQYSHKAFEYIGTCARTLHDDRFSIEFALPVNTPIRAAKEGKVKSFLSGCTNYYQGLDIQEASKYYTNHIFLLHEDGSFTLYSHLQKNSLLVQRDQYVKQGQLLAKTGLSGWIGPIPHLHFSAGTFVGENILSRHTFPIQFNDYNGPLEQEEIDLETMCFSYG